ncbi:MAG: DUF4118 domain-containing protein [Desulfovibrionaceae bacterium]|nr:DUF4118 domain-containing protein [Desulfovibrionaceae bacterium]MBF0513557.1 DUF4118 domain-containing protein [Desulfovibrionaceae bacterium]
MPCSGQTPKPDSAGVPGIGASGLPRWTIYPVAVSVTLATLWLRLALEQHFTPHALTTLSVLPVIVSAYLGGWWPGIVSTVVAALGVDYLFLPPLGSFQIAHPPDAVDLGVLAGAGALVSALCEKLHRHAAALRSGQEALRKSEERVRALVENAGDAIYLVDATGRFLDVNREAERQTEFSREQLLRMGVADLDCNYTNESFAAFGETMANGAKVLFETAHRRKNGDSFPVELKVVRLEGDAGPVFLGIARDIAERKRSEELHAQIESTIRHNLRIPAGNAVQVARLLRAGANLADEDRRLLDLFEQSGQHMLDTLDMYLVLYKIEAGLHQGEPETFDCLPVVTEMIETLTKKVRFASVRLEVLINGRPPGPDSRCLCRGEPKLLRMALQNLLVNALEASPPDAEVVVELSSASDTGCRIEIKNQGVVAREIRGGFFDKYVTRGKKNGTGLGAYSAKKIIEAQGGGIAMRTSDQDNETVVTVWMPRQPA